MLAREPSGLFGKALCEASFAERSFARKMCIRDSLPAIRDSIKRTKALDWLVENAKVTVKDEVAERAAEAEAADAE